MSLASVADLDDLVRQVHLYHPNADEALLRRAYAFSAKAHEGQTRRSGEPYLQHPLAVAGILTFLKLDVTAIMAGLLHDTLEDTVATREELQTHFGGAVAHLVEGVTKIGQIPFRTYEEKQAENFRKMLLSMADDIRVVFIKLADRLHNMRTLEHLPERKQKQIAQETLDIYAPLANRLGMSWMNQELEDLCFRSLKPEAYSLLKLRVAKRDEERQEYVQLIIQTTVEALAGMELSPGHAPSVIPAHAGSQAPPPSFLRTQGARGMPARVEGRPKHLYSIHQKMERQGIPFEDVHDLAAVRIITDTWMQCYMILGLVHSLWPAVHGRFKDYIGTPRANLYQSLHTTVVGPQGDHVEFQIRTEDMHRVAEYGVASHWRYKEQARVGERDEKVFSWLRQFVEWHTDLSDHRQFMDSVKRDLFHLDVFHDVVFAFTPKGEVKELPLGSTSVDFAYAIHTKVGDHCVGAKVRGKIVPLRQPLVSGDTVEILTSPTQSPKREWLKFVRTSRAKTKIKHFLRVAEQQQGVELGRRLMEREFRRHHSPSVPSLTSEQLSRVASEHGYESADAMTRMVGYGHLSAGQVVNWMMAPGEELPPSSVIPAHAGNEAAATVVPRIPVTSVKVMGCHTVLMQLSKCCNPVPGDPILGYMTRGRGVMIHAVGCPNLDVRDYENDRLIEVEWDAQITGDYAVKVRVSTIDRPGVLASVSSAISASQANISRAEIMTGEDQKAVLNFVIQISNTLHLERTLDAVGRVDGVIVARRVRHWQGA